jgi:Tfp pilus assembly protein PilF
MRNLFAVSRTNLTTIALASITALLSACAQPPVAPPVVGLLDVTARPAERALLNGLRAYEDGQYAEAEKQFGSALQAGLASPKDAAAAHKHLAFIYCTSNRAKDCEAAFRAARHADSSFALSRGEQGHPVWGPIYKRSLP